MMHGEDKTMTISRIAIPCRAFTAFMSLQALLVCGEIRADDGTADALVNLEKRSWEAWKAQDPAFFRDFLSDDHFDLGSRGPVPKAAIVPFVASRACEVKSYSLGDFRVTILDAGSAVVMYRAEQETSCAGKPVPSPAWVSSVYAKRAGRWTNVLFHQTPAGS
jgi:hypothetical protein